MLKSLEISPLCFKLTPCCPYRRIWPVTDSKIWAKVQLCICWLNTTGASFFIVLPRWSGARSRLSEISHTSQFFIPPDLQAKAFLLH